MKRYFYVACPFCLLVWLLCVMPGSQAATLVEGRQYLEVVNGIAALRDTPPVARSIFLGYYSEIDDGGQGFFHGVVGAKPGTYADNGGTIIVPTKGDGSAAWLRIYSGAIDIRWFGAKVDGVVNDSRAIANAIAANKSGDIEIYGNPIVHSSINLNGFSGSIIFRGRAKILAGRDGISIFKSTTNAWAARVVNAYIDCNGFSGVSAFDLTRFQAYGSVIDSPSILNCSNGIILRTLNWGTRINSPYIRNTQNPIILMDGNSAVQINHPSIDSFGSVGIDIRQGKNFPNVGVQVIGGYIQGGGIGIRDASINTQVIGTYFERCDIADISLVGGSSYFYAAATNHTSIGTVAYKGRNADAARIIHPYMSSGARKVGLFDFDKSNSHCYSDFQIGAGGKNLPLGMVDGIGKYTKEELGVPSPLVFGK